MEISYRRPPPSLLERTFARQVKRRAVQTPAPAQLDLAVNPGIEVAYSSLDAPDEPEQGSR